MPKQRKTLRVVSWNVNGLRAVAKKGFLDWLAGCRAQVVGIQETRARTEQLPPEVAKPKGWHTHWVAAERAGYSGVGLYMRDRPDEVTTALGDPAMDAEGRVQLARFGRLLVAKLRGMRFPGSFQLFQLDPLLLHEDPE